MSRGKNLALISRENPMPPPVASSTPIPFRLQSTRTTYPPAHSIQPPQPPPTSSPPAPQPPHPPPPPPPPPPSVCSVIPNQSSQRATNQILSMDWIKHFSEEGLLAAAEVELRNFDERLFQEIAFSSSSIPA